ncbi:hypothetical protein [Legionella nagasakiensis]|uniref:hypothetical protein n=1 Tax=Legionella nagasakiensis TaxID=535290 RepID=UPI001055951F|nr:hypothetical protein [Legionella nagasakiensis]
MLRSETHRTDSHNLNCFAYLRQIVLNTPDEIKPLFKDKAIQRFFRNPEPYDPTISYANLYTRFLTHLESQIEKKPGSLLDAFVAKDATHGAEKYRRWINAIYQNRNNILPDTYERFRGALATRRLVDSRPEERVRTALETSTMSQASHEHTPKAAGSYLGRLRATTSDTFKPMLTTSIPSTRDYQYTLLSRAADESYPQELRFGTQGQRHDNKPRVSPLFKEWLRQTQPEDDKKISHVYFNLLGYDRSRYEGLKERELSLALHELEKEHPNIVVITLPADKGLMDQDAFKHTQKNPELTTEAAFAEMMDIANGESSRPIKDFVISPKAKQLLYGEAAGQPYDKAKEAEVLARLLHNSFRAMSLDINNKTSLSPAQQQAVWFHFTKYEMPQYVLTTLKPDTWNASCKDAIDRGGVASAYLNLIRSFKSLSPMPRDEFEQALHAAAALVKGRGLNHHYEIIWNAIDKYVDANFASLSANPDKAWLIHWRNDNTPHVIARMHSNFDKVLKQNAILLQQKLDELSVLPQPHEPFTTKHIEAIRKAQGILASVQDQLFDAEGNPKASSGKRLLLEVVSHTTQMALSPNTPPAKDLSVVLSELGENPTLGKIRGGFKVFVGFIASFTDWGKKLMQKGFDTLERYSEDNLERRSEIEAKFKDMKAELEHAKTPVDEESPGFMPH